MFRQKRDIPIPSHDLVSFIYEGYARDISTPVYVDATDTSRFYTVRSAKQTVSRLVAGFRHAGLKKGDTVLINSAGDIDYSIAFQGIIAAGGVFTGSNPAYTAEEMANQFFKTDAKFILTQSACADRILKAAKGCNIPEKNIFIFNHGPEEIPSSMKSWETLLQHGEGEWETFEGSDIANSTIAAYVMSSGTTGLPKAGAVSHANFLAEITLAYDAEFKDFPVRRLLCLPQFATAAMYTNHVCPIRRSEVAYVMSRFNVTDFINNCEKFQITELSLVPPMVIAVLQSPLATKEKFRFIKLAHGGAAPLGMEHQLRFKALLPHDTPFTQIWGMTETSGLVLSFFYPEHDDTGSIGRPISNTDLRLIGDDGKEITEYGVRGELLVRGPTVMMGYAKNSTVPFLDKDGYFPTGDICYCDKQTKKWYIVDRKKELIKVKGFQVAPPELEALLLTHPEIIDAAVIGVPRPDLGTELTRAYVVVAKGSKITREEVKAFVDDRVASFKRLEGGVVFLDAIEKAASGKILKNKLRDLLKRTSHL